MTLSLLLVVLVLVWVIVETVQRKRDAKLTKICNRYKRYSTRIK